MPDQAEAPAPSTSSAPVATTITSSTSTTTTVPTTTSVPTTQPPPQQPSRSRRQRLSTSAPWRPDCSVEISPASGTTTPRRSPIGHEKAGRIAWTLIETASRVRRSTTRRWLWRSGVTHSPRLRHPLRPSGTGWSRPSIEVPSLPGAGSFYGSGCSPGSDRLPDGIWFGYIDRADNSAIEFDLMCFGPGPEGPGDITNSNPKLRTVPVAGGATVHRIMADATLVWVAIAYPTWLAAPPDRAVCPPEGCRLVWLYVNEGHVTEVVELFFS